jgi:outer membrane protein TolC
MIQIDHGAIRSAGGNPGIVWQKLRPRELWFPALWVILAALAGNVPASAQESPNGGEPSGETALETSAGSPPDASAGAIRISPDEAVQLAIKNNLSLESARIDLDTKKRKSDLVWNQFLPDLEVRGTLARDNTASSVSGFTPVTKVPLNSLFAQPAPSGIPDIYGVVPYSVEASQWHVQGNFSATLALTSALFAGIKTIRQDYRTGLVTFEKAKIQLERDIRKAYYQMLLLEESIQVQRDSLTAAERQVAIAQANYNSGLAPELTLLQARVNRDNLKPDIEENENLYRMAMARFVMDLGLPQNTRFELIPLAGDINFIDLDIAEFISKAASGKPDILELQQQILYIKSARQAQALQLWTPNLIFAWNYAPTFIKDPWKDSWGDGDSWQKGGTFSITLQWKLNNLFPFTKEGQGLKDVDNQIRSATIGMARLIRGTELEIYNTILSLEKTQNSIEARGQTVELANRSYESTEAAYRAGLQDFNSVQNARDALVQARLGVVQQQFNYIQGLIDLEYSMGVPFGTLSSNAHSGDK